MKSYSVTLKAVVTVASESKAEAIKLAKAAVAKAALELLMAECITDGYESLAKLDEESVAPPLPETNFDIEKF